MMAAHLGWEDLKRRSGRIARISRLIVSWTVLPQDRPDGQ